MISKFKKNIINLLFSIFVCVFTAQAIAQPPIEPKVSWDNLSTEQQQMLSRFQDSWDNFEVVQQQRMLRRVERWQAMPPEQRDRIRRRGRELSESRRQELSEEFQRQHPGRDDGGRRGPPPSTEEQAR